MPAFHVPFSETYVDAWLSQFDAYLESNGLQEGEPRAKSLLIQAIPTRLLSQVRIDGTITDMRTQIRASCGVSQEASLNNILGSPMESSESPRALVTTISNAINTALPEADDAIKQRLLKSRFLRSLPSRIRELVTVIADQPMEKLVELTEKLSSNTVAVSSNSLEASPSSSQQPSISDLYQKMEELALQVNRISAHQQPGRRSYSPQQKRNRSPSKPRFEMDENDSRCYYHQRFGSRARNCTCKNRPNW